MDNDDIQRIARQNLRTDQLLGLDAVPISDSGQPPFSLENGQNTASSPISAGDCKNKAEALAALEAEHNSACPLCAPKVEARQCQNFVFGEGDPDADLLFIGEGPGADEDRIGRPFVGRAGQLLDKQIAAMGLARSQVYIANIVKTRPPGNRVPTPDESDQCSPYLVRQIKIIQPKVIVTLGATAAKYLLNDPKLAITRQRGQWKLYQGIDLMPTFHPAYLLRQYTEDNRRKVWDDLQKALDRLGLPIPGK